MPTCHWHALSFPLYTASHSGRYLWETSIWLEALLLCFSSSVCDGRGGSGGGGGGGNGCSGGAEILKGWPYQGQRPVVLMPLSARDVRELAHSRSHALVRSDKDAFYLMFQTSPGESK